MSIALALAAFNCLGGRGIVPLGRFLFRCLFPAIVLAEYAADPLVFLVALAGFAAWFPWGHGNNGFMAVTGQDTRDPTESKIAYLIAKRLVPDVSTPGRCKLFGTVFLSARGLTLYPLFLGLWALGHEWAWAAGLCVLLQGPCYHLSGLGGREPAIARAELLFGLVVGVGMTALN